MADEERDDIPKERPGPAEEVFAREVREPRSRGEPVDFEAVLARHPDLRVGLEALESNARAIEAGESCGDSESLGERGTPEWTVTPNTFLGDYQIIEPLGRGGFGQVYRALSHGAIRRQVALKLLADADPDATRRFEREIDTLGRLNHPSIAKVFEAGVDADHGAYFTMELVEGEALDTFCDRRQFDIEGRLDLFLEVCAAISHAHRADIIHRDLKPTNLLVQTDVDPPGPKVIDFGLVRALAGSGEGRLADETGGLGTPTHMAPEQVRRSRDVGVQADVYSLGVVLYELLTGRLPIDLSKSGGVGEFIHRLRTELPPAPSEVVLCGDSDGLAAKRGARPRELARRLRGDLDAIVRKALAKEPGDRYPFVSDLAEDIRRHLRDEPIRARRVSRADATMRWMRRHRIAIVVLLALAVLVGVPSGAALRREWTRRRLRTEAGESVAAFHSLAERLVSRYREWRGLRQSTPAWFPFWLRSVNSSSGVRWCPMSSRPRPGSSAPSMPSVRFERSSARRIDVLGSLSWRVCGSCGRRALRRFSRSWPRSRSPSTTVCARVFARAGRAGPSVSRANLRARRFTAFATGRSMAVKCRSPSIPNAPARRSRRASSAARGSSSIACGGPKAMRTRDRPSRRATRFWTSTASR